MTIDVNAFDVTMGAFALPPLIAVINQWHWPAQVRAIVALLVCAVYALFIDVLRGPVDFGDWRNTLLTTSAAAFGLHATFWKPSGIAGSITAATPLFGRRPVGPAAEGPPE